MVFSSAIFLFCFLPAVFLLYRLPFGRRYENVLLAVASIVFYAFGNLHYVPLFLCSILLNYLTGLLLGSRFPRSRAVITLNILLNLGIIRQAINWRSSYQIEFVWECWVGIFVTVPFVTFCVLSGLQSIDGSLYEAATMDGAGFWHKLRHITLPMVKPSLTVSTVLNIIYVFNSFPIVYTMTKGAPAHKTDTMITYLYMLSFYERKKGPATALSVIGFLILCVCAGIYMMTVMRKEEEL